jgi:CDP-diglyceride synthetase
MKQCIEKINWIFDFVKTNFVSLVYITLLIVLLPIYLLNYFIPRYGWKILALAAFIIILAVGGICNFLNSALKRRENEKDNPLS